jgi:hypothetical protein
VFRQSWSTAWNFFASEGICRMMSSEQKIGSKYNQVRWIASHCSRRSWMRMSLASHALTSVSIGFAKGEFLIDIALMI